MRSIPDVRLEDVTAVYGGSPGDLYTLLFGELLHPGGMRASLDLAERARVGAGQSGVDLCCGNGAAMRLLVRFRNAASMVGVDATTRNVEKGRHKCRDEKLEGRVRLVHADATQCGLPDASADFIWGEDAWCYVTDKPKLITEAVRLVRPGGTIAFSDWVEGPNPLEADEAERLLRLMNFANLEDVPGYVELLSRNRCAVRVGEDTGQLAPCLMLMIDMIQMQLTWDVLATVGYRMELLDTVIEGFRFLHALAGARKLIQARFIAQRV